MLSVRAVIIRPRSHAIYDNTYEETYRCVDELYPTKQRGRLRKRSEGSRNSRPATRRCSVLCADIALFPNIWRTGQVSVTRTLKADGGRGVVHKKELYLMCAGVPTDNFVWILGRMSSSSSSSSASSLSKSLIYRQLPAALLLTSMYVGSRVRALGSTNN
ncbi:hypothetical protein BDY19DRAFT_943788 [Irpex rosettiformis]|uniref:Uncharacterized protein n=1 Tax=Irpex rosettiformis TaxID=378272 RepID=A0ACB8U6A8_9APHY|nr:hypothetical protein BDY19DRAFT_943788 [Irpex rosettiformis]